MGEDSQESSSSLKASVKAKGKPFVLRRCVHTEREREKRRERERERERVERERDIHTYTYTCI